MPTKIEWAEETWNPITGCTPISAGGTNCYAARMAYRLRGRYGYPAVNPFQVTLHGDKLNEPLKWKKPRRIFVCSMGDLFHKNIPFTLLARIWDVIFDHSFYPMPGGMIFPTYHTFIILTKRPERVWEFYKWMSLKRNRNVAYNNIWLGVTVENADNLHRLDMLRNIPAAVKFVSYEPALGPVDWTPYLDFLGWCVCGAETGPGKRPMEKRWAIDVMEQCDAAGVPFFFKKDSIGGHRIAGLVREDFPKEGR